MFRSSRLSQRTATTFFWPRWRALVKSTVKAACALFGGMQKDTALAVGMRPELAVASNASGGVTAKMISPQSLSVATAATNNAGQEGKLFRFTIGHSIGMTLVLCVLAYLQAGPLSWMLP